jgi:glutamate-5-semialdehyde dehydrogenase
MGTDKKDLKGLAAAAKDASRRLSPATTEQKNAALKAIAAAVRGNHERILKSNSADVAVAKNSGLSPALIDRLTLDEKRIGNISAAVEEIARLPDPIGEILADWTMPIGIRIKKVRVPLGVICMIYESRPNVTVESAALCIKSGNAVILRGGSEAINSNRAIVSIMKDALSKSGASAGEAMTDALADAIQFVNSTDRSDIYELVKMDGCIDLVIPRGGEEMVKKIRLEATVPVLSHGKGLCHTYVDKAADVNMAVKVVFNAKVQRPGVCNATESLLVHREIAAKALPLIAQKLVSAGVELRADDEAVKILSGMKNVRKAAEKDWSTEYLDLCLSVKIVGSLEDVIEHINKYGSGHSDSIITNDAAAAEKFMAAVDSSAVFHNASTRLHDGGVFGFGSEIGISTQKLHARGTMGLRELTTTKYMVYGSGQIRE